MGVHVGQQLAEVLAQRADLQRPRRVGVAEHEREVRHARQHHALVRDPVRQVHRLAVDVERDPAERLQVQSCRGHDDVGLEHLTGLELDALLGEPDDSVGDHRGLAVADGLEQVGVGHCAQPLVPRVVGRVEVLVDGKARWQLLGVDGADQAPRGTRIALAHAVNRALLQHVLASGDRVAALGAEHLAQRVGDRILRRHRHDVRRRTLQHRHVRGVVGYRRHQRHRGGAAADDHDPLAAVVEIDGPVLRVHDLAAEGLPALEVRGESLVVAVVAARRKQPAGADRGALAGVGALDVDVPAGVGARPVRAENLVVEPDVAVDAVLGDRLAEVRQDLVGAGDRVLVLPRLELVAEGVKVGVRADAGVGEQIPGAARRAAGLQDRVRLVRLLLLQVVGRADAGNACADDQHVDVISADVGLAGLGLRGGGHGVDGPCSAASRTSAKCTYITFR